MAKKKAEKAAKPAGVRVIALEAHDGHHYGHEFEMPKGAKLDRAIADKKVRIDDRMAPPKPAEPATEPATPAEGNAQ